MPYNRNPEAADSRFVKKGVDLIKTYTIIGGVNGTGKSSLTGVLKAKTADLGQIIDVDKLTISMGGNKYAAGKKAVEKIRECLDKGYSFTQETTLSGVRGETTTRTAKERGYYIRLYYIGLNSAEDSLERIANRVRRGGHDIPEETVRKRFSGRWNALLKVLPYCDEATFFDNNNGFVEVASYQNGELTLLTQTPPVWVKELQEKLSVE